MAQKKVGTFELNTRRSWIEPAHPLLSISRQCALAGMNRSSWYYSGSGESEENLAFMRLLDEQYTRTPFGEKGDMAFLAPVCPEKVAFRIVNCY